MKKCKYCKKEFDKLKTDSRDYFENRRMFCSKKCADTYRRSRKLTDKELAHLNHLNEIGRLKGGWTKGFKHSEESKKKMSLAKIGTAFHKGYKHSEETKKILSEKKKGKRVSISTEFKKDQFREDKNINWRGDNVRYGALHDWVRNRLGTPEECEYCGKNNLKGHSIHWANISHEYRRELTDWVRLCVKCHKAYDSDKIKL